MTSKKNVHLVRSPAGDLYMMPADDFRLATYADLGRADYVSGRHQVPGHNYSAIGTLTLNGAAYHVFRDWSALAA